MKQFKLKTIFKIKMRFGVAKFPVDLGASIKLIDSKASLVKQLYVYYSTYYPKIK